MIKKMATVDDIIIANDERRMKRERINLFFLVFAIIMILIAMFYAIYIVIAYKMPSLVHLTLSPAEVESSLNFLFISISAIYVAIAVLVIPKYAKTFVGVLLLSLGILYFNSILSLFSPLLFGLIVLGSFLIAYGIVDLLCSDM